MNHSQAVTRNPVHSAASLAASVTRARATLATLLATAGLLLPAAASAQQADGERLFRQRCGTCHSLEPGQNRAGPHLSGIMGRKAGSIEGARYSAALRESNIVWDSQSLDTFLTAPRQMVPGTQMTVGVPNAAQRAAIITYLEGAGAQ
ncbi:c-type cytochrome [Mesorhizobium sp. RMAD-H1]|uniref:c-type cytochrome n=1 Tax=Mesorhizobium sp. RMAD-H1 TaxID=2587065 RepID=UPI00160DE97C|nr:c-type cytochrome [Mesorhizobium sp. RMAD-H1]MBB2969853.1 cytochrome c [Mesorhizobium sp. RMAD-H1]